MAYEIPGFSYTLPAGATALTQFTAVKVDANGLAVVADAAGDIVGVVQNKPQPGVAATIMCNGISIMLTAGAITAGDQVAVDATGAATAATTGQVAVGTALDSAASGEFATVLLRPSAAPAA